VRLRGLLKCSDGVRLRGFVKDFGEKYFATNGIILLCKLCEVKVAAEKRLTAEQHRHTVKRLTAVQENERMCFSS
jgi:hypothetical protein